MAGEQCSALVDGAWFIETERGWAPFSMNEESWSTSSPLRYTRGKTDFEATFQSETEGIQTNLSTGKVRRLQWSLKEQLPCPEPSLPEARQRPSAAKVNDQSLPTCYYLATSGTQSYDGDFEWLIELEKGWSPWMPENMPFQGSTDQPLRYTMGRYDFEVNFVSETEGTQTNISTGKVRRILCKHKADPMPAWEGTGIRRRPAGSPKELPAAPANSAASVAQAQRAERRAAGGYAAGGGQKLQVFALRNPASKESLEIQRPRVSASAHSAAQTGTKLEKNSATVPHYMRGLKSKTQA